MQKPSVGRIVHYRSFGTPGGEYKPECRAAIITAVTPPSDVPGDDPQYVTVCVLNPSGIFFNEVPYDHGYEGANQPSYEGGTWHWPERVD